MAEQGTLPWADSVAWAYLVGRWHAEIIEELYTWATDKGRCFVPMPDPAAKMRKLNVVIGPPWLDRYLVRVQRISAVFRLRIETGGQRIPRKSLRPDQEEIAPYRQHEQKTYDELRRSLGEMEQSCFELGERLADCLSAGPSNLPRFSQELKRTAGRAEVPEAWFGDIDRSYELAMSVQGRLGLANRRELASCLVAFDEKMDQHVVDLHRTRGSAQSIRSRKPKKSGRPKTYNEEADSTLIRDWQEYKRINKPAKYQEFINDKSLDISPRRLKKAIDRERQRRRNN